MGSGSWWFNVSNFSFAAYLDSNQFLEIATSNLRGADCVSCFILKWAVLRLCTLLSFCSNSAEFLQSITGDDGSLLPPSNRGHAMSHSRHSSTSSIRSASPALSISSHGSSFSHHSPRMDMPDSIYPGHPIIAPATPLQVSGLYEEQQTPARVAKMKVTSVATEVASTSRRTNSGIFKCPGESPCSMIGPCSVGKK